MSKAKTRDLVFQKTNGQCGYCGCVLEKGWHVDHMEAIGRDVVWAYDEKTRRGKYVRPGTCRRPDLDVVENMMPACASCNINKHDMDVEAFRKAIEYFMNHLNQRSTQYKFAKKYGLVQETGQKVVFYFETLKETEVVK